MASFVRHRTGGDGPLARMPNSPNSTACCRVNWIDQPLSMCVSTRKVSERAQAQNAFGDVDYGTLGLPQGGDTG